MGGRRGPGRPAHHNEREKPGNEIGHIVDGINADNAALNALSLDADDVHAIMDGSPLALAPQRQIDTITGSTPRDINNSSHVLVLAMLLLILAVALLLGAASRAGNSSAASRSFFYKSRARYRKDDGSARAATTSTAPATAPGAP